MNNELSRAVEYCTASGYKIIHHTWRSAKQHMKYLRLRHDDNTLEPYRCPHCQKFHIGHRRRI